MTESIGSSGRAVLYSRASSADHGKPWSSLAGQLDMCREFATEKGWSVVGEFSEDERGVSGAEWLPEQMERVLNLAEMGAFDVLVCRQMDRLARSLAKQLYIERELERAGVVVAYVLEEFAETPEGVLQKLVKGAVAEYERLEIARRMARGRRQKVAAGMVMMHGAIPLGYREADGVLTIDDEEAEVVRQIFDWYADDGHGRVRIARMLSERGVQTWSVRRKGAAATHWSPSVVGAILLNETYTGRWTYAGGGTVEVPAIIDRGQFDRATRARRRHSDWSKRRTKCKYLLRRLVRCQECGRKMAASSKPMQGGPPLLYYRCASAARPRYVSPSERCNTLAFRADRVDPAAWAWVVRFLTEPEVLDTMAEAEQDQPQRERLEKQLDHLEAVIARKAEKRGRLVDLYLDQGWSKGELDGRRERLDAEVLEHETERVVVVRQLERSASDEWDRLAALRSELAGQLQDAEDSFEARRSIVLDLDLGVRLWWEDGAMLAEMRLPGGLSVEIPIPGKRFQRAAKAAPE